MSKHIIEFDMDDHFDVERLQIFMQADAMFYAITDFDDFIREKIKYTDEESITYDELRTKFWEIMHNRNVRTNY